MDVLRSCYTTKARFWSDPSAPEIDIIWQFARSAAELFRAPHVFYSLNYGVEPGVSPPIGEIPGRPRPWRNGSEVAPLLGTNQCGTDSQFLDGQPGPGTATFRPDHSRTCCDGVIPPPPNECVDVLPYDGPTVGIVVTGGLSGTMVRLSTEFWQIHPFGPSADMSFECIIFPLPKAMHLIESLDGVHTVEWPYVTHDLVARTWTFSKPAGSLQSGSGPAVITIPP